MSPTASPSSDASAKFKFTTGLGRVDACIGAFEPKTIRLVLASDPFLGELLARLSVRVVIHGNSEAVFVDGGNAFDPYGLAERARYEGRDPRQVLARIHVARAFTVHQLSTIIQQTLGELLEARRPALLVVDELPKLFLDDDVRWEEAKSLLEQAINALHELTERYELATVITATERSRASGSGSSLGVRARGIRQLLTANLDDQHQRAVITLEPAVKDARALRRHQRRYRHLHERMAARSPFGRIRGFRPLRIGVNGNSIEYCPAPPEQLTLDEFRTNGNHV